MFTKSKLRKVVFLKNVVDIRHGYNVQSLSESSRILRH